jgi:hypothetical protein
MDLNNQTQFAAHLFRGCVDEKQIFATLVVRIGYVVRADGTCESVTPPEVVRLQDEEKDGEIFESDAAPVKAGVDVCVIGRAYPRHAPATTTVVRVQVGEVERRLRVTGDRVWQPRKWLNLKSVCARARKGIFDQDAFQPSTPVPFENMPMSWSRAFGGHAALDGNQVPHAENPAGRGFLIVPDSAAGTFLPNLEDSHHPVVHWRDWPTPICFAPCPRISKLRTDRGIDINNTDESWMLKPAYFSTAHPWLLFSDLKPECPIMVEGMSQDGPLSFRLPNPKLTSDVSVGRKSLSPPLRLDTVEIFPDQRRLSLVFRTAFRYYVHPGEQRVATIAV